MKKCSRANCQNPNVDNNGLLAESEFRFADKKTGRLQPQCKHCAKLYEQLPEIRSKRKAQKKIWDNRPEAIRERRNNHLLRSYSMTNIEYNNMLEAQGMSCAICGCMQNIDAGGKLMPFFVDHNHITGKVRGLLCRKCNSLLGLACTDEYGTTFLTKAIQYINCKDTL